jgi:hypothetical protein
LRPEGLGEAEIETGIIDEENGVGVFTVDEVECRAEFPAEISVAAEDIPQADHGGVVGPVFHIRGHGAQFASAQSRDPQIRAEGSQFGEQRGGVGIAAGFAGHDEEVHGLSRVAGRVRRSGG